jgi:excisionase family DNA binding protein
MAEYTILSAPLREELKSLIREVLAEGNGNGQASELLTPDELAAKLKLPVSWVYEQSRQGALPTHRLGRYIRFDLQAVLRSRAYQEKKVDIPS